MQVVPSKLGFNLHFSQEILRLQTAAEAYFYLGWSVIPLLGDLDPSRPKVPAIPWTKFQQYRALLNDYKQWFSEGGFGGLGIVTGCISQLVVLDFDSEDVFSSFRAQYPDLLETHIVQSANRQLPHLYFKLPDSLHLDSQKGQGIDILSNGCYVVAPPTTINGLDYKITRGGMPKPLTERDIRRIQAFTKTSGIQRPIEPQVKPSVQPAIPNKPVKATSKDLHSLYRYLCQQGGRNEALFRTCLFARDTGWQKTEALNYLVELHSHQPASSIHCKEIPAHRQREAQHTIQSAFSRPARRNRATRQSTSDQLPNSVREALMQRKMTFVIRTIEGLALASFRPGQVFSMQQAEETLKGLVGRDSVHKALHATASSGSLFFTRVSPVNPLRTAKAVARSTRRLNNINAFMLPKKNQEIIGKGRPQHFYRMPQILDLCRLLGVEPTNSDPLERADLASAHKTRMALHRELIKRRPGKYTRRWLASRLGVTKPTINSYNRLIPIHSRPNYTETTIRWSNTERLPFDEALRGAFLLTLKGKKYPALRTIASMLLAKGEGVCLKEQGGNIYWFGDAEPHYNLLSEIEVQEAEKQQANEVFLDKKQLVLPSELLWKNAQLVPKEEKIVKTPRKIFHKPFTDASQEALAQNVYAIINQTIGEARKTVSLANARRITLMQAESRVRAALNLLQQRKMVINPTGFLITILRSKYT